MIRATELICGRDGFRLGPLDLALENGTMTALIGPNGGGKSTLLRTLAGLWPPLGGVIEREGVCAFLPAPGAVDTPLDAGQLVLLGRAGGRGLATGFSDNDRQVAGAVMARLGIAALANRRFDRLSSGQQVRVLLARTLAQDARTIALDEPTALLDPAQAAGVTALLDELRGEGRALIVATHDLALAARADRVVALGSSIDSGEPRDLLDEKRLTALYGAPVSVAAKAGQSVSGTTSGATSK